MFEDFAVNISKFEELLQEISASTTSGVISERLPPSEIWKKSEPDVTALRSLAEQVKKSMLVLKPEKAASIEKRSATLTHSLNRFKELLFRKGEQAPNPKLALDELRKAMTEGASLLDLAKEIKGSPSEGIAAILKLKEVYDSKEYLSAIPVPEVTYVRFASLKTEIEGLKRSVANLERSLSELRTNLDGVVDELTKFRALPAEKAKDEPEKAEETSNEDTNAEPSLMTKE